MAAFLKKSYATEGVTVSSPVGAIKGVGPAKEKVMRKAGVETLGDLVALDVDRAVQFGVNVDAAKAMHALLNKTATLEREDDLAAALGDLSIEPSAAGKDEEHGELIARGYKIERVLNVGAYAQVIAVSKDAVTYACKAADLTKNAKDMGCDVRAARSFLEKEVCVLRELGHKNIVKYFDAFCASSHGKDQWLYIVLELLEGGDAFDNVLEDGRYTEAEAKNVLTQLVDALCYMHETAHVAHRDIKLENIMFCDHPAVRKSGSIKLVDFGTSRFFEMPRRRASTRIGTPITMAPEIIALGLSATTSSSRKPKPTYDAMKADMFSLGCVLYALLVGDKDSDDWSPHFTESNKGPSSWDKSFSKHADALSALSSHCIDFLEQCLKQDPAARISTKAAADHSWLCSSQS